MKKTIFFLLSLITFVFNSEIHSQHQGFSDNTDLIAQSKIKSMENALKRQPSRAGLNIDLIYTRFTWDVDPAVRYINGQISHHFRAKENVESIIFELNNNMVLDSIIFRSHQVNYQYLSDFEFSIELDEIVSVNQTDSILIYYQGEPIANSGFGSFETREHNSVPAIWTLSQPFGARDWWPGKNDLTDKIDSIDVIIKTPSSFRAVSHGILVSEVTNENHKTYHYKHNYPIVSYLIAFAATNYAVITQYVILEGDSMPIINYVYPEDSATIAAMIEDTPEMIELFDTLFAPYPFKNEKYGHAQFSIDGGGMEHQTVSFMAGFGHDLRAHELAHSWFGNMITLNSWHDIWINEGFATYANGLSFEHMHDGYWWPIWKNVTLEKILAAPDGSVYVEDTTSVPRIFSSRLSYHKGAYLLHMLRWLIGDDAFFNALRNYLNDPQLKYSFTSFEIVKNHFENASGRDLTSFFDKWYYGEGWPKYGINVVNSTHTNDLFITIFQETSHPSVDFFDMPVHIRIFGDGQKLDLVCNHNFSGQIFSFPQPEFSIDSVQFDPDKWLIAKLDYLNLSIGDYSQIKPRLFPNPVNDYLDISLPGEIIQSITVYSNNGNKLIFRIFSDNNDKIRLNTSSLPPGIFLTEIKTLSNRFISKFVK